MRKPPVLADPRFADFVDAAASKGALIDLVHDLLVRQMGEQSASTPELTRAFVEAAEPVLRLRGDRIPRVPARAAHARPAEGGAS